MSTDYVPTPAALPLAGTPVPDDGDPADAASVGTPLETALDAIEALQQLVSPTSSGLTPTITRMLGDAIAGTNCTLSAAVDSGGVGLEFPNPVVVTSGAGAFSLAYMLDLPHGCTLSQARAYFYEDTASLSAIAVSVVRRDYINVTVSPGDPLDCPSEVSLGSSSTQLGIAGGMSYTQVAFAAHTIDRDDGADYFVRVTGTCTAAGVRFMPKVRVSIGPTAIDQGAA
jgi:hypothetical protein